MIRWLLRIVGLLVTLVVVVFVFAFFSPRPPLTTDPATLAGDGSTLNYCELPELDGSGLVAADIPKGNTPGCGYDHFPLPILADCTEPLAEGADDIRGLWMGVEGGHIGHVERVEQCGERVVVTASGIIHDYGPNSTAGLNTDDTYIGDADVNHANGQGGNDLILGNGEKDLLKGGDGNDTLSGGTEADTISGEAGDDLIAINSGDLNNTTFIEVIDGGTGNDTIALGTGSYELSRTIITNVELISGSSGADTINGHTTTAHKLAAGAGDDVISLGSGADTLSGEAGNDTLSGGGGGDSIDGGDGNDLIVGGSGVDTLIGGAGNDTFSGSASEMNGDTISGLEAGDIIVITGNDTLVASLNGTTLGSTINLDGRTLNISGAADNLKITATDGGTDTVLTFATATPSEASGGSSSDGGLTVTNQTSADTAGTATGRTLANNSGDSATGALVQNTGNGNVVTATLPSGMSLTTSGTSTAQPVSTASTTLTGEIQSTAPTTSAQSFLDGHGQTFITHSGGVDLDIRSVTFSGGGSTAQTVQITGQSSGGSEAFVIDTSGLPTGSTVQLDNIEFAAIVGNATVNGGAGQNYVVGDDASQFISLGAEDDTLAGGGGNDTVGSAWGEDIVYGNQGADYVFGGAGMDTLYGGQDGDTVFGGNDNDVVYGNLGNDTLSGGENDDVLFGGQNEDIVYGNTGNDTLNGNLGNDTLLGGQGNDLISGGAGNDQLHGNHGNDTLAGGDGADTFVFTFAGGNDQVNDFQAGTDSLSFASGLEVTSGTETAGTTTLMLTDGGTVTLVGVTKATLMEATGWVL